MTYTRPKMRYSITSAIFSENGKQESVTRLATNEENAAIEKMLSDLELKVRNEFLSLAKEYEATQEKINEIREKLNEKMEILGIDSYIQDPDTLLVYKVVKPTGTFMYYRDLDYKRTAKEGERGGTVLSKKEAEEAGFVLKK